MDSRQDVRGSQKATRLSLDLKSINASSLYPPSEDTFAIARVIDSIITWQPSTACDLGCGTGVLSEVLGARADYVVAVDISYAAVAHTRRRLLKRGIVAHDAVCCDALTAFRPHAFDVVVSNPPYLPSCDGDPRWDGGPTGVEVPLMFVEQAALALKQGGIMVVAVSSLSSVSLFERGLRKAKFRVIYTARAHMGLMEELLIFILRSSKRDLNYNR